MSSEVKSDDKKRNQPELALDVILSTQPELGPSIPDGGYGWIIFLGTLFFQALIPCLLVNFGIFVAFSKLENDNAQDKNMMLWADRIISVPLFHCISRTIFDSFVRHLTNTSTSPRLMSVVGTCLTCAGLLFVWMGITGKHDHWLFVPAGILTGTGSSFITIQCEILLSLYFRAKLPVLAEINRIAATFGFVLGPIILGSHLLSSNISHILLWYQAIVCQGLIVSVFFKKPQYLKDKEKAYRFIQGRSEDEDVVPKDSRELQSKNQGEGGSKVVIDLAEAGTSKKWVTFKDEEEEEEEIKYAKVGQWESFDEERKSQDWERFEDDGNSSPRIVNNMSLAEETNTHQERPVPLFSDLPVNNNESYAYDDEIITDPTDSNVFEATTIQNPTINRYLSTLKEPTFYKSLLMMIANIYSTFAFYALYPTYLYIKGDHINIKLMSDIVGLFSVADLLFTTIFYWFNIDKKRRAFFLGAFYMLSCIGYFVISDFKNEYLIIVGGVQVSVSCGVIDYIAKPLLKIPTKGGTSHENILLTVLSGLSLFLFLSIDVTYKTCFRLVALLHALTSALWLANLAYKKLRSH